VTSGVAERTVQPVGDDRLIGAAVGARVRSDWRRRRRELVAIALLAGLAGGVVLGAVAASRRTASSLDRLASVARSGDSLVDISDIGADAADGVRALPMVEQAGAVTIVFADIDGVDADVGLLLPRDAAVGWNVERDVLRRGRRPDPSRADEVAVTETTARLLDVDVGDRIPIATLTPDQVAAESYEVPLGPTLDVLVTGITRGPGDLIARDEGTIVATAALYPTVAGRVDEFATYLSVRLRPGTVDSEFEAALGEAVQSDQPLDVLSFNARTQAARRTISTLAVGLAAFAVVAAIAAVVIVGQALMRHVDGAAANEPMLRALGMTRRQRSLALWIALLPAAFGAAAVAGAVAIASSPLAPIGLARQAEPRPGVEVDLVAVLLGAAATVVAFAGIGAFAAFIATRTHAYDTPDRVSRATSLVARAGSPPPVVNGVALALDRRQPELPVRSTTAALVVAVAVAVGAVTFSASLDRVSGSSDRWGSPWDLAMDFTSESVDAGAKALASDPSLAAVGRWDSGAALVDDTYLRASRLESLRGELGFTLLDGHQPGPGEIVIGSTTAERSGLALGDVVVVARPDGDDPGEPLRVAGIGAFPEIDEDDFADGIGMTTDDFVAHAVVPDLFESSQVVVRVAAGESVTSTAARLTEQFEGDVPVREPVRPGVVGNLAAIRSVPRLVVAFVAVLGVASLAHVIRTTRSRRRDHFDALRALGMTRRQRWACSLTQSLTLTTIAIVIGVPLGVVVGRAAWSLVAEGAHLAGDAAVPVATLLFVGFVCLAAGAAAATPVRWSEPTSGATVDPSG
jgi:hypothetical protein